MRAAFGALSLETLIEFGRHLDDRVRHAQCSTFREVLAGELLKIRRKDGVIAPLELNAAQREFERRCGEKNIILKARQLGMTTWVAARFFLNTITRPGTLTVQVAQDSDAAESIFRIVHRMLENLPAEVRGALRTSRANVRQIVFPRLDSEYRVESAADASAGRGLTIQNLHCSEVSRWPAAEEVLAGLRAAVVPGGEVVLESTANGSFGAFYREWQRADESGYVRHFFPWFMEPQYRVECGAIELTDEERELAARFGLASEQVAFRRNVRQEFGRRAAEEYAEDAESCFLAAGECVFDTAKLESRRCELAEAVERRSAGRLEIYWPAQPGREYVIGVDAAGGGVSGDYSAIEVVDRRTGLQCAEWYGHCSLAELARETAALGREYNTALVAVERNNHGYGVLAYLEAVERYPKLYGDEGGAGWATTMASRREMVERLMRTIDTRPELVSSGRTIAECKAFVRHEDGRCAAAVGEHDDALMALAMGWSIAGIG